MRFLDRYKRLCCHKNALAGLFIITTLLLVAIFGPLWVDPERLRIHLDQELRSPDFTAWLGYSENGVDILGWLILGARLSLFVSVSVTFICAGLGLVYGAVCGFIGGRLDALLMRLLDILLAFPGLLLAIYMAAILPPSIKNTIIALCATGWVGYARLVRAQVLAISNHEFILASKSLGSPQFYILYRHVLPNIIGPFLVQASFGLSSLILAEASLSFLGLGVPAGTPSWGALVDQGVAYLFVAPHVVIFPSLCIALSVLGFNFLGDGLRDILDVHPKNQSFLSKQKSQL